MLIKQKAGLLVALLCLSVPAAIAAPPSLANETAALAAFDAGHYREAIVQYQRLLRERPGNASYHMKLAESYEVSGKPEQAETHATEVLKQENRHVDALLMMGRLSGRKQNWETAKSYYERAVKADKTNAAAHLGRGQALMELGDDVAADGAFAEYDRLVGGN